MSSSNERRQNLHLVFVYGTLKKGEPNYHVLSNSKNGSSEFLGAYRTVDKYPLVIASKYNIPFLLDVKNLENANQIDGEVYAVDDSMLSSLDQLENHPNYYVRRQEPVELLGEPVDHEQRIMSCWIYFLPDFKPNLLNLPFYSNYSSTGDHGLPYVTAYDRTIPNYSSMNDVRTF